MIAIHSKARELPYLSNINKKASVKYPPLNVDYCFYASTSRLALHVVLANAAVVIVSKNTNVFILCFGNILHTKLKKPANSNMT